MDQKSSSVDERLQPFPSRFASNADLFVAQSGKITANRSEHMHRHDFYELVWVMEGACDYFCDFVQYPLTVGCLIFISPGQLHDYLVKRDVVQLLIYGFRPNILPLVAHRLLHLLPFDNTKQSPIFYIPATMQDTFFRLFQSAHQRFDSRSIGWESIVASYLQTILTEAAYSLPSEQLTQSKRANILLTRAFQDAVESHYREWRHVHKFAEKLGVTSNYLVRTVREVTGTTPKKMLQERLLLEAKRLLVHTPYSVGEISLLLQFPNATTFSRWFKHLLHQTPSDFREQSPV